MELLNSALIEVDVQNDFCPGGALAVPKGDEVLAPLNTVAERFAQQGLPVVATQDWHPADHVSFASAHPGSEQYEQIKIGQMTQTLWPDHCVQGSPGAEFHPQLDLRPVRMLLRKGIRRELDSYSAFFENDGTTSTGLHGILQNLGIRTVFIGGLALDYCVLYSALDAARLGYQTIVLTDAARSVGVPENSTEEAYRLMAEAGIQTMTTESLG